MGQGAKSGREGTAGGCRHGQCRTLIGTRAEGRIIGHFRFGNIRFPIPALGGVD